jgi:hypothetical protein
MHAVYVQSVKKEAAVGNTLWVLLRGWPANDEIHVVGEQLEIATFEPSQ